MSPLNASLLEKVDRSQRLLRQIQLEISTLSFLFGHLSDEASEASAFRGVSEMLFRLSTSIDDAIAIVESLNE